MFDRLYPFFLAFVATALCPGSDIGAGPFGNRLRASWGSSCVSVETEGISHTIQSTAHDYHWQYFSSPEQIQLMDDSRHVGTFWFSSGKFYARQGEGWSDVPSACPITTP